VHTNYGETFLHPATSSPNVVAAGTIRVEAAKPDLRAILHYGLSFLVGDSVFGLSHFHHNNLRLALQFYMNLKPHRNNKQLN
jgi:hypothetical protein